MPTMATTIINSTSVKPRRSTDRPGTMWPPFPRRVPCREINGLGSRRDRRRTKNVASVTDFVTGGGPWSTGAMRPAALALALVLGCRVDAGPVPDAAPCRSSTAYFVTDVWLRYLDANQCAVPACHGFDGGHGYLRFRPPGTAPDA